MIDHAYLIPLVPLIASIIVLLFGKEGPKSNMPLLSIGAMGFCWLDSCSILYKALTHQVSMPYPAPSLPWFTFGDYPVSLGLLLDGPAVFMTFVVTLVSLLVQIYSLGYMHGDTRFKRFYAYVGFFTASMLGLVLSSNLLVVFACWELMGVSSYLLIGFWFEKPGPAYASKKAFITTKLGDLGFYLGLLLLFAYAGTFEIPMLAQRASMGAVALPVEVATAAGLLLLCGAIGKSAQVPLFIWLPDAMEGPTPVSALIHAATMVAAGIFLVARTQFLYAASPLASDIVAWVGLLTAFMAATMALVAYDIKRVLAFSTVSQLGYMMLGLGVGAAGYTAALFHLTTHAFFKALLFLGAGSVIHAMHTNDMREMGGLSKKMLSTSVTMAIATLAITGFPGFSGFYSKEAILAAVYGHSPLMWAVALLTAGLTTFYMFRMMFMTFAGNPRDIAKHDHAHESPSVMTVPLWVLAVLSALAGFLLSHTGAFEALVHLPEASHGGHHPGFLLWSALAVFAGAAGLSYWLYGRGDFAVAADLKAKMSPIFTLLENRYGFDDFFLLLVKGSDVLARICFWIDERIIDRVFVDAWGLICLLLAEIQNFIDTLFIDGAVDLTGTVTGWAGGGLRGLVRGQVQEYLLYVAMAASLFAMLTLIH